MVQQLAVARCLIFLGTIVTKHLKEQFEQKTNKR
jgi:hypothetical protein